MVINIYWWRYPIIFKKLFTKSIVAVACNYGWIYLPCFVCCELNSIQIVSPAAKLHCTVLFIKWKPRNIDL